MMAVITEIMIQVLIAVDSNKNYISTKWFELPMVNQ